MKVTNISSSTIYLRDLKFVAQAQTEGRRGEDRYIAAGASVYLPNTSQVLRSAIEGDLNAWLRAGGVTLDDTETLADDFGYAPIVYVLKQVGATWVDATGTVDIVHNVVAGLTPTVFESVTVTNTTAGALTYLIRLN